MFIMFAHLSEIKQYAAKYVFSGVLWAANPKQAMYMNSMELHHTEQ